MISAAYLDVNGAWHGCIRKPDGTFINYDPPDAGTGSGQGTYPTPLTAGVSPDGAIVGEYFDPNYVWHTYLRSPDGYITEIDDPHSGTAPGSGQGTLTLGVNPAGEIYGVYIDANYAFHGYVRERDGAIKDLDVPGAGTGQYQGTNACWFIVCFGGLNPSGTIAGLFVDNDNVYHGYVRTRDVEITKLSLTLRARDKTHGRGLCLRALIPKG